jgi:hypothetical protein
MSQLGTKIVIDGDSTGFERAAGRVGAKMGQLGGKISGDLKSIAASYVSFEAFKTLILDVGKAALAIDDFSDRQNTSYEETQRLVQAFKMFGLEAGDAEAALMKLAGTRKSAAETDDDMLATFKKYGVSMDDLNNASLTNFDLMKKIGVAIKDMKVNPTMMSDMKELFGKSGAKLIGGLKELGEGRDVPLISDEAIAAMDKADRAFERMKNSWHSIAAEPIAGVMEEAAKAAERATKSKTGLLATAAAGPMSIAGKLLGVVVGGAIKGTDKKKKYDVGGGIGMTGTEEKPAEKQYIDQRAINIAKAQADLDTVIQHALVSQLAPLEQNIAKRQEILALMEKASVEDAKGTEKGSIESIRLKKEAIGIAAGIDSEAQKGQGKIPGLNLDAATKANLGSGGGQLYDPMVYASQNNTSALKALTDAIKSARGKHPGLGMDEPEL